LSGFSDKNGRCVIEGFRFREVTGERYVLKLPLDEVNTLELALKDFKDSFEYRPDLDPAVKEFSLAQVDHLIKKVTELYD